VSVSIDNSSSGRHVALDLPHELDVVGDIQVDGEIQQRTHLVVSQGVKTLNDHKRGGLDGKSATELIDELIKVGTDSPGSLGGTGLFQTLTALKLREVYDKYIAAA